MKYIVLIFSFFIQVSLIGQTNILKSDSIIKKALNHIGFPNQELQDSSVSSIVFVILYHDKNGNIDSIVTSSNSLFGIHLKSELQKTDNLWKINGKHNKLLPVVIPFIFFAISDSIGLPRVNGLNDWIGRKQIINCIFLNPILIIGYPKIS